MQHNKPEKKFLSRMAMGGVLFLLVIFCFVQIIKISPKNGLNYDHPVQGTWKPIEFNLKIILDQNELSGSPENVQFVRSNSTMNLKLNVRSQLIRLKSFVQNVIIGD